MTETQRKTPFGVFLSAGYAAYRLAHSDTATSRVIQPDNPYREAPFRDLWQKGWRDAEREFKRGVPFRSIGYVDKRTVAKNQDKQFRPKVKHFKPVFQRKVVTPTANFTRLENRFNNKRTAV